MSESMDIRILELKDIISKLNTTIDKREAMIEKQTAMIETLQKTLENIQSKLDEKDATIANLTAQLDYLKQKLFGSTSEPSRIVMEGQLNLFQQPVEELPAAEEDETKPAVPIEPEEINLSEEEKPKNRKKKSDYEDLFGNLPTEQIIVDTLTDEQKTCAVCGTAMVPIGQEVLRTELKYTPPKLTRVEYIGTTWACPKCKDNEGDNEFVKDKGAPPALIKGSYVVYSALSEYATE